MRKKETIKGKVDSRKRKKISEVETRLSKANIILVREIKEMKKLKVKKRN